jgi:hypothetical protein
MTAHSRAGNDFGQWRTGLYGSKGFDVLAGYNTHIIAVVLFRCRQNNDEKPVLNNYIVTAYQKETG